MCDKTPDKNQHLTSFVEGKVYITNDDKEYTFVKDTSVYGNKNESCLVFSSDSGCMYLQKDGLSAFRSIWMVKEKPAEVRKYANLYPNTVGNLYGSKEQARELRAPGGSVGMMEQVWCDGKLVTVNLLPA